MHTLTDTPETAAPALAPIQAGQRIEALDAVRGFALLGICVMNIEFFNRAMSTLGRGMPGGLTGIDWLASSSPTSSPANSGRFSRCCSAWASPSC